MSSFVLVHGAWHGAWCWEKIVPLLEARGHAVRAIDLPGHGDDPQPPATVDWDDYMQRTGEVLAATTEPPIVVGHSLGGGVITGAADRWPERIRALVYLCAVLPWSGDFMAQFQPESILSGGVRPAPDGSVLDLDPAVVRWGFYHDCSEDDVARAAARLCSQPARVFQMTFELAPDRFGRVPRHYVECLQDHAIDLLLQRAMVQATPCTIHTLDASHSPFYSMPDQLAAVLEETARTG